MGAGSACGSVIKEVSASPCAPIALPVLLELLQGELVVRQVRIVGGAMAQRAYQQLEALETAVRETGRSMPVRRGNTMA